MNDAVPRSDVSSPLHEARVRELMSQGQMAQRQGRLVLARERYDLALRLAPGYPEAAMMLGIVCYELGDVHPAVTFIVRALELTQWRVPSFRQNLGPPLARLAAINAGLDRPATLSAKGHSYRIQSLNRATLLAARPAPAHPPLVSVVVPCVGYSGPFLREALESVYAQSYRHVEVVILTSAARDDAYDVARSSLMHCPFPNLLVRRDIDSLHIALNEAVAHTKGKYINPLCPDDQFSPDRLIRLVTLAENASTRFAFSGMRWIGPDRSPLDPFADSRVYAKLCKQAHIAYCETVGHAILAGDVVLSAGNQFFSRELFNSLAGFRALRHNHAWDFCLRALWFEEPVYVEDALYIQRLHEREPVSDEASDTLAETVKIYSDYFASAFDAAQSGREFTPNVYQWGDRFTIEVLRSGAASLLPPRLLRAFALSQLRSADSVA